MTAYDIKINIFLFFVSYCSRIFVNYLLCIEDFIKVWELNQKHVAREDGGNISPVSTHVSC